MFSDKVIDKILASPKLLSYISLNKPVIGYFISGSPMFNIHDQKSDYDIDVILDDKEFEKITEYDPYTNAPILYFKDKQYDKKIHWYYHTESHILTKKIYHFYLWIVELYYATLNDYKANAIKIVNEEKYENFFKNTLPVYYKKSIKELALTYRQTLEEFQTMPINLFGNCIRKDHYHLFLISLLIQNKDIKDYKEILILIRNYTKRNTTKFSMTVYNDFDINSLSTMLQNLAWLLNYFKQEILDA